MTFVRAIGYILLFVVTTSWLTSCRRTTEQTENTVCIPRLDSILFAEDGVAKITQDYSAVAKLWGQVLGTQPGEDPSPVFQKFVQDTLMHRLQDSIQRIFSLQPPPDLLLSQAFGALTEHFPSHPKPLLYYYNSGFQASILVADSLLAVGLDRFLGSNSSFYLALSMPRYLAERMRPQYIVPVALEAWLTAEFPLVDPRPSVLAQMLYYGKIKYATQQLAPTLPDSLVLQYTAEQLDWLSDYEKDMWIYLSEKRLLYEKNQLIVSQFTRPAPFTNAFGQKSPGQAVNWLGYKIIASYMKHHPELRLEELFAAELGDEQLLQNARYRP